MSRSKSSITARIVLANSFLRAGFDGRTGNLLSLGQPQVRHSLIDLVHCQYFVNGTWFSEDPREKKAIRPEVTRVDFGPTAIESTLRTPHIEVTRCFELGDSSSLLKITFTIHGTGSEARLIKPAFPYITLASEANDVTEDPQDLHFDGAELGEGLELPCWRVLFCKGHREGLLVAARSKLQMSHVQLRRGGIQLFPHISSSYSSDYGLLASPMVVSKKHSYQVGFEIGPWQRRLHRRIIRAARLELPVPVGRAQRSRRKKQALGAPVGRALPSSLTSPAVELVARGNTASGFHCNKWLVVPPGILLANAGSCPPPIVFKPKIRGVYRILVGTGGGAVLSLKLAGEPCAIWRAEPSLPFHSLLAEQPMKELDFGIADLDGRPLRFETTRHRYWPSRIDYIRFEKLSPAETKAWRMRRRTPPCTTLAGFADTYDTSFLFCDSDRPSPETFRANIWAHKRAGFRKIYWRIHGECADFPTKIGTMRPLMARAHGVFEPQAMAYSRALQRFDLLKVALAAAREFDIELYGWIRFNAFMSQTWPEYFKMHLDEFADESELGDQWGHKMCYAIPAVRRYIIGILIEATAYGLDGLSLGFLRHPPILMYHRVLVEAYKRKFGRLPPRDWKNPDCARLQTLPPTTPGHVHWYQFRAGYMTQFGRELRAALNAKGLRRTKVSIWVRPNHALFDGIDVETWTNEGLCDEVVADIYTRKEPAFAEPTSEWKKLVQARVPLLRGIGLDIKYARANAKRFLREGYDGISTYESNEAVCQPRFLAFYESLRVPSAHR